MSIFINQSGITLYQALNPSTLPVSITEPELVLETELPNRLQHTTGITYEGDDRDGHYTRVNQPLSVNGNISSSNLTSMNTDLQTIMNTLTKISYDPIGLLTTITGKLSVGTLNGNKIGVSAEGIGYTGEAPFLPVCKANGITEIGHRIDFHLNDNTFRDYSVALENNLVNQLSIKGMDTNTYGNLELSGLIVRPSSTHSCRLIANTASNMLWFNSAGVNTWVCDATSAVERWSTTRDNALIAVTRTTGMTYTPAVLEPSPAPAYTTFAHNIYSVECYANRYHTNSTSSLPINSVANVSTWGAMRIVRTGLAQNTPCGYMFGRGNDPTNMSKNLCAIYYVSPTTDITKGEIRIGIETEASTSSTNCITFDTDTKVTKFPANITTPYLNGYKIGYEVDVNSIPTIINNYLDIANVIHFLARDVDPEPFNPDYHGYLKFTSPNTLTLIEGDGPSRIVAKNITDLETSITGITQSDITKSGTIIGSNILSNNETRLSTIESNLEGLSYVDNLLLQSSDYTQATVLRQHLFIDLAGKTYVPQMGMRALKTDLASTQEMMLQVGKNNTAAISFVYRFNDTTADRQYRLDFAGKSAYSCKYGATSATEHEIKGNLKVFGTVTENASKTITHYTMYEGELQPGCFVETTGQIFRDTNSKLSPYEDCITVVRQATSTNNKIVGVCTEIINEEVTDDYGNINQPAGKYCKYATHGDVLIKCISAVYNVGEILIPIVNGYAKKGQQGEILDAMLNMIPRAKITSVETAEIDSESVCAFISI